MSEDVSLENLINIYKRKLYKDEKARGHDPNDIHVQSRVNKVISRLKKDPKKLPGVRDELNAIYNQGQETQNKFLISIRKIKKKDKEVMVCLDHEVEESKKWMKFSEFIKDVQAI